MNGKTKIEKNNEYKYILIGDSSVGKTTIFKKVTTGVFFEKNISTIGIDKRTINFKDIEVDIKGKKQKEEFKIVLFDTAGQERYHSITKGYFQGSDVVYILYDITSKKTFKAVETWLESITEALSNWKQGHYLITLFGNKLDFVNSGEKPREVGTDEAEQLCDDKEIIWGGEISVKDLSQEELNEQFIKTWKIFISKFGIKEKISEQKHLAGSKYVKRKKKSFC